MSIFMGFIVLGLSVMNFCMYFVTHGKFQFWGGCICAFASGWCLGIGFVTY